MAAINPDMEREYAIEDRRAFIEKQMNAIISIHTFDIETPIDKSNELNDTQEDIENIEFDDNEVGNGVYRSNIITTHTCTNSFNFKSSCFKLWGYD